jgi:hypothetical protein
MQVQFGNAANGQIIAQQRADHVPDKSGIS